MSRLSAPIGWTWLSSEIRKLLERRKAFWAELVFPDHVGGLDGLQICRRCVKGLEAGHRPSHLLDEAAILFDDVVQIPHLQDLDQRPPAEKPQQKIEVQQTGLIGATLINHDLFRDAVVADGLSEKRLGRSFISSSRYRLKIRRR